MKKIICLSILFILIQQSSIVNHQLFGQSYIQAQTGYFTNDAHYPWLEEWCKLNGSLISYWSCCGISDGLKFVVIDSATCMPWISRGIGIAYIDTFGSYHCQPYNTEAFDFFVTASFTDSLAKITNFINSIPIGDYVLVMSHKNHHCQEWDTALINAFRSIGSTVSYSNRITDGFPYILFGRKGAAPGSVNFTIGDASGDLIFLTDSLPCKHSSITEINFNREISIFPNPANDNLTIEVPQKSTIEILNIQGQIIKTVNSEDIRTIIDIGNLPGGVYIVKVKSPKVYQVGKFIKQ